jgi:hypothetical protein
MPIMSTNGSRPKEDVFNENSEIWWYAFSKVYFKLQP